MNYERRNICEFTICYSFVYFPDVTHISKKASKKAEKTPLRERVRLLKEEVIIRVFIILSYLPIIYYGYVVERNSC